MRILSIAALALCAALTLMLALPAMAQAVAPPASAINFDPFIAEVVPYALMLFSAIITAAVTWATKKLNDWTGINIEAKHREALQSALLNGARATLAKYTPNGIAVDVKSIPIKEGIDFVLSSVPDAVKHFGLTPADIEKHLIPKIGALTGLK